MNRKKELKNEYKRTARKMGIFQIVNLDNDKRLVGQSPNLDGIVNRHRFQLEMGSHPVKRLQKDWDALGSDRFLFEILEELPSREDPDYNFQTDLNCLEDLWLEKLEPYDGKGYNIRKLTREERLWKIAAARNEKISGKQTC